MLFSLDLQFDKEYTRAGDWWIPDNPSNKVTGRLTYSPESGINVDCAGHLLVTKGRFYSEAKVVHGQIEGRDLVTLFHASASVSFGKTQTISAGSMLLGMHAESLDAEVGGVQLLMENLDEWYSAGPFQGGVDSGPAGAHVVHYEVPFEPSEAWRVSRPCGEISIAGNFKQTGQGHSVKFSMEHNLAVRFDSPVSLLSALKIAYKLELLLSLMAGCASRIQAISFSPPDPDQRSAINFVVNRPISRPSSESKNRNLMPVTFESVRERLPEIFESWVVVCDDYAPIIELLKASMFQKGPSYIEDQFLTVAQAVEGFCRINCPEHFLHEDYFNPTRDALLEAIPNKWPTRMRELARGRVSGLNEFSLKDRLQTLFERNEWLRAVLATEKNEEPTSEHVAAFIKLVTTTRNSLTHVEAGRNVSVNYTTYWQLRAVLCAVLLNQAGVRIDQASAAKNAITFQLWWE